MIAHGIPDDRELRDGDIINVDVTVSRHDVIRFILNIVRST